MLTWTKCLRLGRGTGSAGQAKHILLHVDVSLAALLAAFDRLHVAGRLGFVIHGADITLPRHGRLTTDTDADGMKVDGSPEAEDDVSPKQLSWLVLVLFVDVVLQFYVKLFNCQAHHDVVQPLLWYTKVNLLISETRIWVIVIY